VRRAADAARAERAAGPVLVPLFRHAVEAGKRARHETRIQRGTTSLAHAVVELAADHSLGLEGKDILLVGAGEMGTGIARALAGRADLTGDVVVANRGPERAMAAADLVAGRAVGFDDLPEVIQEADVILTSTAAGDAILSPERLSPVLAKRAATSRGRTPRPLVIVDAAVPRDIDPAVGQLDGVLLLDLEDVRRHAEEQMERREQEIPAVRAILAEELERYRTVARGRMADPVVSALRARGELLRERELERYRTRIEALDPAGRELVDAVTKRLVAKLLHEPTVRLKDAAGSPRGERLAEAVRVLFDL
jgi:glutamyl-tRNA reductase